VDEAPLAAEGTEQTVEIVGRKIVLRNRGVKTMLKRGFALYRDPKSLAKVFDSPSKKVVTAALAENKELARVIAGAVKRPADTPGAEDAASPAAVITEALKHNRKAVVDALRENDGLVKDWLRDHKDLAGIVLKGDIHIFIEDVTAVALMSAKDGRRLLALTTDGQQLAIPYEADHDTEFRQLCDALRELVGTVTELRPDPPAPPPPPPAAGSSADHAPRASVETKTCPMCAEDVKAAAILCRFCGHRFDEA
jgi:hypothetical protein